MKGLLRVMAIWPITVKVPLMVAVLMVAVSLILSNQVLLRLSETQQRHLEELTGAYLDGLSASVVPHVLRDDIWEIFDQLDRTRHVYVGVRAVNTLVATPDGNTLASSDPHRFPTQQAVPSEFEDRFGPGDDLVLAEEDGRAFIRRALSYQDRPIGWIYAQIDIRDLMQERREVLIALVLTNLVLTAMFAGFGYLAVRRMMRPVGILAQHLDRGRGGRIEPIPLLETPGRHSEFGRLFRRYNAMVRALNQKEALAARLAEEEKLASLGRLASGLAHEINNPLGGMFNAIDTIERHEGDPAVRHGSLAILKRGLRGMRDVVRATLVTYKGGESDQPLRPAHLDDLQFLLRQEVSRRRLTLVWRNDLPGSLRLPSGPIRQVVLNLLLNACAASPVEGRVTFHAEASDEGLVLAVADEGPGLPKEITQILRNTGKDLAPPVAGHGLGTWMVSRLVGELDGRLQVGTGAESGTRIEIMVPLRGEVLRSVA